MRHLGSVVVKWLHLSTAAHPTNSYNSVEATEARQRPDDDVEEDTSSRKAGQDRASRVPAGVSSGRVRLGDVPNGDRFLKAFFG